MITREKLATEIAHTAAEELKDPVSLFIINRAIKKGGEQEVEDLINIDLLALLQNRPFEPLFPQIRKLQRKLLEQGRIYRMQSGTLGDDKDKDKDKDKDEPISFLDDPITAILNIAAPIAGAYIINDQNIDAAADAQERELAAQTQSDQNALAIANNARAQAEANAAALLAASQVGGGGSSSGLPSWAIPVGIGVLVVGGGAYLLLKK